MPNTEGRLKLTQEAARRTHIGIRSDRVGAAYWIAVCFRPILMPQSPRNMHAQLVSPACVPSSRHCWLWNLVERPILLL